MKNILIDSNVFISSFLKEEEACEQSDIFLAHVATNEVVYRIILPRLVILESTVNIYRKTTDKEKAMSVQRFAEERRKCEVVEFDAVVQKTSEHLMEKVVLKTSDLTLVAMAYLMDAEIISWDKQLLKEASKVVSAITPTAFLSSIPVHTPQT